jgi:hypothetical protein
MKAGLSPILVYDPSIGGKISTAGIMQQGWHGTALKVHQPGSLIRNSPCAQARQGWGS